MNERMLQSLVQRLDVLERHNSRLKRHRSMILQSLFGTQRGWLADFDWQDVGPRFLEPITDGKYKGFTMGKWLPDLVYEYYRLSGRHERTGRPFKAALNQLGLEEFTRWSQEASQL